MPDSTADLYREAYAWFRGINGLEPRGYPKYWCSRSEIRHFRARYPQSVRRAAARSLVARQNIFYSDFPQNKYLMMSNAKRTGGRHA